MGFVHQVRRAIRQGRLQGYRVRDEALQGLRGRLRFEDQIRRRFGRFPPAEVRYDDFTVDIEENRLLRAAIVRLAQLGIRSPETRRALRALADAFADVMPVRYSSRRVPEISYSRLNARYRPAVELARRILRETSFDLAGDGIAARGFLIDMNRLFEDFVVTALREALGVSAQSFPQNARRRKFTLDEAGAIDLRPDLSWWSGLRCRFVGDVKYKRSVEGHGTNADLYQLLSYSTAADLSGGLLIYAAGEAEPGVHLVRHLGKRLEVVALDLSGSPHGVLGQITLLAERIREMAACPSPPTVPSGEGGGRNVGPIRQRG
ncbi:MAG: restriction endonuclease [bacterium]|nr:restriction endonuclease [bacterium]